MTSRNLIVILGPTASGKSALGIRLAKKFNGVIISADSRQVYRGMDIGTGKVTRREMQSVPHFLLSVASPAGQYSVARYVRDVRRALAKIPATTPVFLVGGSPFYIDAVTKPGSYSPVPPNPALRRRLASWTTPRLLARLQRLDPERARTVDPSNRRRMIRAIEIAAAPAPKRTTTLPDFRTLKLGLNPGTAAVFAAIDRRVDARMRHGMLGEVRRLRNGGLSWKRLEAFGLEYRYLGRHLRGTMARAEALAQLKSAIHDFARRQMTWWKRDRDIVWIASGSAAERRISDFLRT